MQHDDHLGLVPALTWPTGWPHIHPAAQREASGPAHHTPATMLDSAVRYPCPVNGSIVLITDPAALVLLKPPLARLRCAGCGELHLLKLSEASRGGGA